MSSDNLVRIPVVAGFVDFLCVANIVENIISAEKRCNYPGRSRVTRLVVYNEASHLLVNCTLLTNKRTIYLSIYLSISCCNGFSIIVLFCIALYEPYVIYVIKSNCRSYFVIVVFIRTVVDTV